MSNDLIDEPFYLGIEGEHWEKEIPGLYVPIPETGKGVAVLRSGKPGMEYVVVGIKTWEQADSLLMAAALVTVILEGYRDGTQAEAEALAAQAYGRKPEGP